MSSRDSVFVDLSTLNVLFKRDDKFVVALNYSAAIDRLGEDIAALRTGFDIYLCAVPRIGGAGDFIVNELSLTGFPFTTDKKELYSVLKYFRETKGVNNVYLCNWVHNYISCARISEFSSVVYYGDGVLLLECSNSMVHRYRFFGSRRQFHDEVGEDFDGYGDIGLLDIDGLKAQYPELEAVQSAPLTVLAPLVQCYKTNVKLETEELYTRLGNALSSSSKGCESVTETTPEAVDIKDSRGDDSSSATAEHRRHLELKDSELGKELGPREGILPVKRRSTSRLPLPAKVFLVGSIVLSVGIGFCIQSLGQLNSVGTVHDNYYQTADDRIAELRQLSSIYTGATSTAVNAAERLNYVNANELGITVVGFDHTLTETTVRCACASADMLMPFEEYLNEQYFVSTSSDLGMAETGDGIVYQFSVTFS